MLFDEQSLQQITIDVCQSMLGLELTPVSPDTNECNQMVASVEILGSCHTVVEVFAHEHLMTAIAEVMYAADGASLSEDEIRDAFGEIANMIGGNVKGGFGEAANLSLPTVGKAYNWLDRLPAECLLSTFMCCEYPLTIVMREYAAAKQFASLVTDKPQCHC